MGEIFLSLKIFKTKFKLFVFSRRRRKFVTFDHIKRFFLYKNVDLDDIV